ncbi:MAG: hypothetical protein M1398_05850 [Deltaproteobacteria bacterium]|jgi:hypothetical protein|nr:hypothetical protein [Deltaproteobacteria bacterium]MDA8307989.1 hypothetical protein [Deltaproteobacteria bacterium]
MHFSVTPGATGPLAAPGAIPVSALSFLAVKALKSCLRALEERTGRFVR